MRVVDGVASGSRYQNPTKDDSNRRKFPRLNVRRAATIGVAGSEFVLATVNLSFSGAFLETDKRVTVGTQITFALEVNGQPVTTNARVVHQSWNGLAILFITPPEDFVTALCQIIGERVLLDAEQGAAKDEVPGRIALLVKENNTYQALFTSSLSGGGVWALSERTWPVKSQLWLTLSEHGLFDCQAEVVWSDDKAMRLEFIAPSEDFTKAYQRVLSSFMH